MISIDPGRTGAVAWWHRTTLAAIGLIPEAITPGWSLDDPTVAVIEWQQSRPGEGHKGAFALGRNFGMLVGGLTALGWQVEYVRPQVWKAAVGLVKASKGESRALAADLYPQWADMFRRVKDDGRAEAVLIGHWWLHHREATP